MPTHYKYKLKKPAAKKQPAEGAVSKEKNLGEEEGSEEKDSGESKGDVTKKILGYLRKKGAPKKL